MSYINSATSANIVFILSATGLLAATRLETFSDDDMVSCNEISLIESGMTADGKFWTGIIYEKTNLDITLMPFSPSTLFFDQIYTAQRANQKSYPIVGEILFPSIGKSYTLPEFALEKHTQMPNAKKILQPQKYTLVGSGLIVKAI